MEEGKFLCSIIPFLDLGDEVELVGENRGKFVNSIFSLL